MMTFSTFIQHAAQARLHRVLAILCLTVALAALSGPSTIAQDANTTLPLSPIEKAEKDGTALRMSIKDLTKLALQSNLDIAISDTNEEIYSQKVVQAHGPYDPAITLGLGVNSSKAPNTNLINSSSAAFNQTDRANWNFQFSQNVPTGGGITATYNTSRADTNQTFSLFSPQWNASTTITFTQPLRRNFRIDQTRGTIKLANLDIKTNDSQFKQKVNSTIATIQGQYWDLLGAIRDYTIKREAVQLAQVTLRDNKKKVEIGTLAPIEITKAQAAVASGLVDLITSEERIYSAENSLRAVISNDRNSDIWKRTIVPSDSADFSDYKVDLHQAIETALQKRPELEQLDIKLNQSDINYRISQNLQRWQFDFVGAVGTVGVAGPQSVNANGIPLLPADLIGGVGNAYKTIFTGGFTNWSVGFNLQIPLKNRTVQSQLAQIKVQKRQVLMTRKQTEQQIQVDVRNAVQHIDTTRQQVETAKVSRQLAQEQLDGEEKRFEAGLSQNYLVLQYQTALSTAKGVELQALIAYKKSIIALQTSMYTLLESNDFAIAKTNLDSTPSLK